MDFDVVLLVDLHPVDQRGDDQVLCLVAGFVVLLRPGQQLPNLGLGGFAVLFLCIKPGFGLLNSCGVLIQLMPWSSCAKRTSLKNTADRVSQSIL